MGGQLGVSRAGILLDTYQRRKRGARELGILQKFEEMAMNTTWIAKEVKPRTYRFHSCIIFKPMFLGICYMEGTVLGPEMETKKDIALPSWTLHPKWRQMLDKGSHQ